MTAPDDKPPLPVAPDGPADLAGYVRQIRPYVWLVGLVAVVTVAVVLAITMRQTRIYEAVAVLEYDPNPPRPLGEGVEDVAEPVSDFWMSREFFETQNRIIASRLIAERVVRQLGLHQDRTFVDAPDALPHDWAGLSVEDAALLLQSRLTVTAIEGTRLVNIRYRDPNPERAALVANTLADTFIEKTVDRLGSTVTSLEWLGDQLDTLRGELDESELALHRFKQDHNILSVSMEDRQNLVAGELEAFNTALTEIRTRRIELRARLTRLRGLAVGEGDEVEDRGAGFEDYPAIQALQTSLRTQLAEREALSTRYDVAHPRIQEIDREISALRAQLEEEIASVLRAAEADVREASEMESGLRAAVADANSAGLELNLWEIEYSRLNRERENNSKLYEIVLQRTTETDLTRMLRTTHVRTVDRALAPTSPVSPRVATNLAFGGGGGLVLGVAFALLIARLDRRIKTIRQVEEIGLTVLGVLPVIEADAPTSAPYSRSRRRRRDPPAPAPDGNQTPMRDLIVHTHPMSSVSENCRTIRTNLMFMSGDEPMRTVAVTSASPREGKTTITANLAISIAQSGKRVLVVDTDMRRPRVHRAFGVKGRVGLTSYLVGEASLAQVAQETVVPGLHVVACGPIPPNPSELLHREKFQHFVREARDAYDFVFFDSPPLGPVTDAAVLGPQVDGVAIVVKAQQTTTDAVASMLRQLRDVGATVVGGIVNGFDPRYSRYEAAGSYYYYRQEGYYASHTDEGGGSGGSSGGSGTGGNDDGDQGTGGGRKSKAPGTRGRGAAATDEDASGRREPPAVN